MIESHIWSTWVRPELRSHLLHELTPLAVFLVAALAAKLPGNKVYSAEIPPRPNIIIILADDQGCGDFGATGNPVIRTPNIDTMAARSASMSTFYISPVFSPTRANLMTGRYNFRTRVIDTWLGRSARVEGPGRRQA